MRLGAAQCIQGGMKTEHFGLDFGTFARIIDNLHDEIIVYDNNYRIIYINKACERHYGFRQEEMIGKSFWYFVRENSCWNWSVLPTVYELKKPLKQEQQTYIGADLFTIATPLFDESGEVEFVPMNVRDDFHEGMIERFQDIQEVSENPTERLRQGLVSQSPSMIEVLGLAEKVAEMKTPCLLLGESGSGKSLLAKYIHANSSRRDKPFVVVNCASIPTELFESELFGHVRGAFTGAVAQSPGLFAEAQGGMLLLDEISELPFGVQAKLLHVLQENEYRMVGGTSPLPADVKILAASNRNLRGMVEAGTFREDLYYRLNVVEITVPPLRRRPEDVVPFIYYFLQVYGKQYKKRRHISEKALEILCQNPWRGNVRELAHVIERLVVTSPGTTIEAADLSPVLFESPLAGGSEDICPPFTGEGQLSSATEKGLAAALGDYERRIILESYNRCKSTRRMAEDLGITQSKASRLLRKYRIES